MPLSRFGLYLDDTINRRSVAYLRDRGWRPRTIGLTGYGSAQSLHVLGRVVMADPDTPVDQDVTPVGPINLAAEAQRGWRSFFTAQVGFLPVVVRAGSQEVRTTTDRGGYIDVIVRDHGLPPGWHEVTIEARAAAPTTAKVLVVDPEARGGIVSDIDDTIMVTMLPRALLAAWNTFVRHTSARRAVPGMAELYRSVLRDHPDAPVFYLSTGAWNVVPTLRRFMERHGFPEGPMLMTDWGPTNTGWFRSGIEHKRTQLRNLMITFPEIRWLLVGDDGQHDPMIYDDVAREHPGHVAAIAIRELTPAEQVLSHGTTEAIEQPNPLRNANAEHGVPTVHGKDGFDLARQVPGVLEALERRQAVQD
ncbi:App1 family protein [Georgenia sp. SYP-B2076]|uniref:App1 family protein n=1 Tax=Georgenia sp. SYP-B2076 TaxID=2495881 RepID=UPI000F8E5CAB|nr:phosphatase domain-containing protein [Georgenia sp. SYP-B2076]